MNFIDLIIAIPVLWTAFKGLKKGLVFEVATLVALLLGIWGGIHFSDFMSGKLSSLWEIEPKYLPIVSFCVTFGLVVIAVLFTGKLIEKFFAAVALSTVNKVLGACFGALKAAFILSVLLVVVESVEEKANIIPPETKAGSVLYEPLAGLATTVVPALSESKLFKEAQTEAEDLNSKLQ